MNDVTLTPNCVIHSQTRRITFMDVPGPYYYGSLKFIAMKNSLYVIAGLLLVIWGILFWGLHTVGAVHFLLAGAAFIILVRIVFRKKLGLKK